MRTRTRRRTPTESRPRPRTGGAHAVQSARGPRERRDDIGAGATRDAAAQHDASWCVSPWLCPEDLLSGCFTRSPSCLLLDGTSLDSPGSVSTLRISTTSNPGSKNFGDSSTGGNLSLSNEKLLESDRLNFPTQLALSASRDAGTQQPFFRVSRILWQVGKGSLGGKGAPRGGRSALTTDRLLDSRKHVLRAPIQDMLTCGSSNRRNIVVCRAPPCNVMPYRAIPCHAMP